jgi:hypothetical protein
VEECSKVVEDVRFWRRKRFVACQRRYCSLREADILPVQRTLTDEEMAAAKKKYGQGKALLASALADMIRYAG